MNQVIEGIYGKSNGNGPLHLLRDGETGVGPVCGITKWHPVTGESWWRNHTVCKRCADRTYGRGRTAPRPQPDVAGMAAALGDLREARVRFERLLTEARGTSNRCVDGALVQAQQMGYTMQDLGDLIGLSRERVRQRIAAHAAATQLT